MKFEWVPLFFTLGWMQAAWAVPAGQPYIDKLLKGLETPTREVTPQEGTESYTQKIKNQLEAEGPSSTQDNYIDRLKRTMPEQESTSEGYTERLGNELKGLDEDGESKAGHSAIHALKSGKGELQARRPGTTHHAAGFALGAAITRNMTAGAAFGGGVAYTDIYAGWSPDLRVFYEYQPWHSEWFGNIGLALNTGFTFARGTGKFQVNLVKPWATSERFGTQSQLLLKFVSVPLQGGLTFRINALRIIRPYVQAVVGPIFFSEFSDNQSYAQTVKGYSTVASFGGGINIPIDWLDSEKSTSLYELASIKRYSLAIDFLTMKTLSGPVVFANSSVNVGLNYEF